MAGPAPRRSLVELLEEFDDDAHVEVIDGEIVHETMTSFEHGDAQVSLGGELKQHFRGDGPPDGEGWWIATEVTVFYAEHQIYLHDVSGWRKSRVPQRPTGARVVVRPDWVCEILSSNRKKDLVDKRRTLHEHGVLHYWIVDLEGPVLTVHRHHPDGYLVVASVAPGHRGDTPHPGSRGERARLEPFDAAELEVARLFGDIG